MDEQGRRRGWPWSLLTQKAWQWGLCHQGPLAACLHSNSWKGPRQEKRHLDPDWPPVDCPAEPELECFKKSWKCLSVGAFLVQVPFCFEAHRAPEHAQGAGMVLFMWCPWTQAQDSHTGASPGSWAQRLHPGLEHVVFKQRETHRELALPSTSHMDNVRRGKNRQR